MATAGIAVYITSEAWNNDPDIQDRVASYFNETFDVSSHSVDVTQPTHFPDPPTEKPQTSFTDSGLCSDKENFDALWEWWRIYHRDCHDIYDAKDCNLLVTNYDGVAGTGGGDYAISAGGQINLISSTEIYNKVCHSNDEYDQMSTTMQEAGHCLTLDHDMGIGYENDNDSSEYYTTPMLNAYIEDFDAADNYCGDYIENYNSSNHTKCFEFNWSSCASSNIDVQ